MTDPIKGPSQQEPQPHVPESKESHQTFFSQGGLPIQSAIASGVKNAHGEIAVDRPTLQSDREDVFSISEERVQQLVADVVQNATAIKFSYIPSVQDIAEAISGQPQKIKSQVWEAIATITLESRKESGDSATKAKELQKIAEEGNYEALDISPVAIVEVMKKMFSDSSVRREFTSYLEQ